MSNADRSQEHILQFRQTCRNILSVSPKIRYAGAMNKFGRTISGQLRKGVVPLLRADEARNEYFIEATRNQLRKNFEHSIGKTEYTLTENQKVKILTLSDENSFYYISIDKDTTFDQLITIIEATKSIIKRES